MENKLYDIIIIGAGPAGMSAAIYAGRSGKDVALIDKDGFGGNIAKSPKIENLPGFLSISGPDFAASMFEQVKALSTIDCIMEEAVYLDYRYGVFRVSVNDDKHSVICGKSLILAIGTKHRKLDLGVPDVYYCATCDGPFFKNKSVLVVGSGNTGAAYALELASYCKDVYLCDIAMEMRCEKALQDRIASAKNIHWLANTTVKTAAGKGGKLSSVTLTSLETLKVSAIFAAIGIVPNTSIVGPFAELDEHGYIVSADCTTSKVPGVFAAGDCRTSKVKQAVTAAGDGAVAAIEAMRFLETLPKQR